MHGGERYTLGTTASGGFHLVAMAINSSDATPWGYCTGCKHLRSGGISLVHPAMGASYGHRDTPWVYVAVSQNPPTMDTRLSPG